MVGHVFLHIFMQSPQTPPLTASESSPSSPTGKSGSTATPNRLPAGLHFDPIFRLLESLKRMLCTVLDALELKERHDTGGVYGIGQPLTFIPPSRQTAVS